jgi:hypothetical protein
MPFDPMSVPAGLIVIGGGLAAIAYIGRGVYRLIVTTDKIIVNLLGDKETGELSLAEQIETIRHKLDDTSNQVSRVADVQEEHGERLARVEYELRPNGGGSLRDRVDRTLTAVQGQDDREARREERP